MTQGAIDWDSDDIPDYRYDHPSHGRGLSPETSAPVLPAGPRWCVRCVDCLTVVYIVGDSPSYLQPAPRCGVCGGPIENMGKVERDRLVFHAEQSVCNQLCTSARGPTCDCKCGGENHGSHRTVMVTYDRGAAPVLTAPTDPAAVLLRATTEAKAYRASLAGLLAQLDPILARKRRGEFVPRDVFERMRELQAVLRELHEARTVQKRRALYRAAETLIGRGIA